MKAMKSIVMLAALVFGAVLGNSISLGDDGANKAELKKLQGKWSVVSGVKDGQEIDLVMKLALRFTFKDDVLTVESENNADFTLQTRTVRLDAGTTPKLFDISETKTFDDKDKVIEGVYSLEGDTLKWCFLMEGDQPAKGSRPAALESKEGSNTIMITLKKAAD